MFTSLQLQLFFVDKQPQQLPYHIYAIEIGTIRFFQCYNELSNSLSHSKMKGNDKRFTLSNAVINGAFLSCRENTLVFSQGIASQLIFPRGLSGVHVVDQYQKVQHSQPLGRLCLTFCIAPWGEVGPCGPDPTFLPHMVLRQEPCAAA